MMEENRTEDMRTIDYDNLSDFEKLLWVEKYNRQLKLALSAKTEKLIVFNAKYNELRSAIKNKYPDQSKLITYKEELRIARKLTKESKQRMHRAELDVIELQMEIAELKAELRIEKLKNV